jgi:hypothetical protein
MTIFRTEVEIPTFKKKLAYTDTAMLIGSCFTENIGIKLKERCFQTDVNPFGILYNPDSVANSIEILLDKREFTENDIFYSNENWKSFYHHSRFSNTDKKLFLSGINNNVIKSSANLKKCNYLFITFGTAWIYELLSTGQTVSNCHKLPSKEFRRHRLSPQGIIEQWQKLLEKLLEINPGLNVIFTVSPIRHIKDGAHENQVSKSVLLYSIDEIIKIFNTERVTYFPSYEIIMDELRDYRFYSADMLHISETAIDFIWEKFSEAILSSESKRIFPEILKSRRAASHIPFNNRSADYQLFIEKNIKKLTDLTLAYPFLNIEDLLEDFLSKRIK